MPFVGEDEEIGFVGPDEDIPWEGPTQVNPALPESVNFPLGPGEKKYITGQLDKPLSPIPGLIRFAGPVLASAAVPEALLERVGLGAGAGVGRALLGRALVGGAAGGASELAAQGVEEAQGTRSELAPSEIGASALQMAVPYVNRGNAVVRPILNALAQGGGALAADAIRGTQPGIDVALGATLGGGTPLAANLLRKVALGAPQMARGNFRQGFANALRPENLNRVQEEALASRKAIEAATGTASQEPVKVPMSLSEALGMPELTRQMKVPSGELTEDQLRLLHDQAMQFATRTERTGKSANDISNEIWDVLGGKRDAYNLATSRAVDAFSQQAARVANDADANVQSTFSLLFPGNKSAMKIGEDISQVGDLARESAKAEWSAAYNLAKDHPQYANITIPADDIRLLARGLGMDFAKNEDGTISVIAAPAGARGTIGAASEISGSKLNPDFLTLEQARQLASQLGGKIRGIMPITPGAQFYVQSQILDKLKDSINNATRPFPDLHAILAEANSMYASNIGRFANSMSRGVLNDIGNFGGKSGEVIVSNLTGEGAETYLNNLEELAGKRTPGSKFIGEDFSADMRQLAREAFLQQAQVPGQKGGRVNLAEAAEKIRAIPTPVRDRLFPDFPEFEKALRLGQGIEKAKAAAASAPEKFLEADAKALNDAFGSGDTAALTALAQKAKSEAEATVGKLKALGLDGLEDKGKFGVLKYLTMDTDLPRIRNAMGLVTRSDPQLAQDVRALFLDSLIEKTAGKDKYDPAAVADALKLGSAKSATSAGSAGGAQREVAEAILGKSAVEDMRKLAEQFAKIKPAKTVTQEDFASFLAKVGYGSTATTIMSGSGIPSAALRVLVNKPSIKYRIVAKILTDDALRRQAMQATGPELGNLIKRVLTTTVADIAREQGNNSSEARNAEQAISTLHQ